MTQTWSRTPSRCGDQVAERRQISQAGDVDSKRSARRGTTLRKSFQVMSSRQESQVTAGPRGAGSCQEPQHACIAFLFLARQCHLLVLPRLRQPRGFVNRDTHFPLGFQGARMQQLLAPPAVQSLLLLLPLVAAHQVLAAAGCWATAAPTAAGLLGCSVGPAPCTCLSAPATPTGRSGRAAPPG